MSSMNTAQRRQLAQLCHQWAEFCASHAETIHKFQASRKRNRVELPIANRIADNYIANGQYALEVARMADPDVGVVIKLPGDIRKRRTLEGTLEGSIDEPETP